jgi:hypothetical protein
MVRIISALILAVTAACAFANEPLALVDNPPERHIVIPGDTLWGISGKFLKQPWRWPEVWQLNKSDIKNPHLIYPGDIIVLDTSSGSPRLKIGKIIVNHNGRAQPQVYSTPVKTEIPSIPPHVIEPYISQPLIIEPGEDANYARIVATEEDRMLLGNGENAFVTGIPDASILNWQVFRRGKPLKDPETGDVLAHEAFFLGNMRLVQPGDPAVMRVTVVKEEMARGDRLLPAPEPKIIAYVPHRPDEPVEAKVMSIYGGAHEGGAGFVVSLNRGENNGLEVGHVLALFRDRVAKGVEEDGNRRYSVSVPQERYALVFIFRVFNKVAYGLVIESSKTVKIGDSARNP